MRRWMPAFAGMTRATAWMPAFAGMTRATAWMPAFAGMTRVVYAFRLVRKRPAHRTALNRRIRVPTATTPSARRSARFIDSLPP